jgi:hypothetical protein
MIVLPDFRCGYFQHVYRQVHRSGRASLSLGGIEIEIQGLNTWGDVVEIGLRTTRIYMRDTR